MTIPFLKAIGLCAALATGLSISPGQALPGSGLSKAFSSHMATGGGTKAPTGHIKFCRSNSSQCRRTGSGVKRFTKKSWRQLVSVNASVNRAIRPRNDRGADDWRTNVAYGDCEDYALTKRKLLLRQGWPSSSLLITTGYLRNGTYHAVLVARTDRGDYVLDNMSRSVKPWRKVNYRWKKQQSSHNPRKWVRLTGGSKRPVALASAKQSTKSYAKAASKKRSKARGLFSKRSKVQKNRRISRAQGHKKVTQAQINARLKVLRARLAKKIKRKYRRHRS
ncbi:MAG: transglutaminase-like cysteine peptidase [Cohaesibacter sp.]|jgi:predicted transglutaminase-like cysteine proteinase|nr:transglutaminase-like cysteine peptidase [Cohaesibacter sp.]